MPIVSRLMCFAALFAFLISGQPGASAQAAPSTITVDSPSFVFSPGNWVGDSGRLGALYRQSWNPGAYFRVSWTTSAAKPSAALLLDVSELGADAGDPPRLTYNVDGVWTDNVACSGNIPVQGISGAGVHTLTVYVSNSQQQNRWGSVDSPNLNVVRVTGLSVDGGSTPLLSAPMPRWALIVGDSITEGIFADNGQSDNLADYSFFVGAGLQQLGYEYGVSACGYSGWLRKGDGTQDVPAYYAVSGSSAGIGGVYDDSDSRWDKIDYKTSLLDSSGHLSGYGGLNEEPSIILINYGTNDGLNRSNPSDTLASITQSLAALRLAAPNAKIFLVIPFGQYDADLIHSGLRGYSVNHPKDKEVFVIDLGQSPKNALSSNGYLGGLHPNMRGHAILGSEVLAEILTH